MDASNLLKLLKNLRPVIFVIVAWLAPGLLLVECFERGAALRMDLARLGLLIALAPGLTCFFIGFALSFCRRKGSPQAEDHQDCDEEKQKAIHAAQSVIFAMLWNAGVIYVGGLAYWFLR